MAEYPNQINLFKENDEPPIDFHPAFYRRDTADQLEQVLYHVIDWQQHQVVVNERSYDEPRLTAWYSLHDDAYEYTGSMHPSLDWPPELRGIRADIANRLGLAFDRVFCNLYRNGNDRVGWHADNEFSKDGKQVVIASVSFGAVRRFWLRRKDDHRIKYEYVLESGDLLIMHPMTQVLWQHHVPRETKVHRRRINLTFRHLVD